MDKLGQLLLYFVILLFLTGGFYYRGEGFSFEISQINVFALLLLLILLFGRERQKRTVQLATRILDWGARASLKIKIISFVIFFGVLFFAHWVRHVTFETFIFDMSFEHQPLFYPFRPNLLHCDMCRMKTAFGEHMQWTFLPLALLTAPFQSDTWIFFLQNAIIASSLWFFLRKGPLEKFPKQQFWFFILFTLMAGFRSGLLWDFREDILAVGGMLVGMTFLFRGRLVSSLIFFCSPCGRKKMFRTSRVFSALSLRSPRSTSLVVGKKKYFAGF